MPRGLCVISIVTLVASAGPVPAQQTDPLRGHLERAQSFQLAGELERAEAEYRTEVLPRALRRLGNLSGAEGDIDQAVELLGEAAREAPADVEIRVDLAVAWLRKADLARAGELAGDAVAAAPGNSRARSVWGRVRLLAGDAASAAPELRKALDQEPRFDTAFALALANLHLRRLETARAVFDQMMVVNAAPDLLVLIGRAYLEADYPALAAEQFSRALSRDEGAREAHYYAGLAHLSGAAPDRRAKARAAFEAELRANPAHAAARAALDALADGRAVVADPVGVPVLLDLLPTAASMDEEHRRQMRAQLAGALETAWHNLAVIHARRGESDAAEDAKRRAARWSAGGGAGSPAAPDADAAIRTAEKLVDAGDIDGAERTVAPVLAQVPELPAALRVLGSIRAAQGRNDEAEALLRTARERDTLEQSALVTLAGVYLARGQFQRALAALDEAPAALQRAANPVRLRAYLGLERASDARALVPEVAAQAGPDEAADVTEALIGHGMMADADAVVQALHARGESSARLLVASARLRWHGRDAAGAEALLHQSLGLDPASVGALRLLAQIASERGDETRAADLLLQAREHAGDSPEVLRELADASIRAARPEDALGAARRLAALRPDDVEARHLLGVALLQNQDWPEAIEVLASPPPEGARDPRWPLALGLAEFGRRNYQPARAAFERALALDSGQVEARYHLGLIAREQGRTTDAIAALSDVLARDSAHGPAHLEVGTLFLLTGDLGRARRHLECAAVLNPDDPAPHYQLGLLARRAGDTDRARREMQRFEERREKLLAGPPGPVVKRRSRKGGC